MLRVAAPQRSVPLHVGGRASARAPAQSTPAQLLPHNALSLTQYTFYACRNHSELTVIRSCWCSSWMQRGGPLSIGGCKAAAALRIRCNSTACHGTADTQPACQCRPLFFIPRCRCCATPQSCCPSRSPSAAPRLWRASPLMAWRETSLLPGLHRVSRSELLGAAGCHETSQWPGPRRFPTVSSDLRVTV